MQVARTSWMKRRSSRRCRSASGSVGSQRRTSHLRQRRSRTSPVTFSEVGGQLSTTQPEAIASSSSESDTAPVGAINEEAGNGSESSDGDDTTGVGLYIAISARTRMQRLHFGGRCNAAAICKSWEPWGKARPPRTEYQLTCSTCWRSPSSSASSSSGSES